MCFSPTGSDGGGTRFRGRAVAGFGESHPVCGAAEASCALLPGPAHTTRPVSMFLQCVVFKRGLQTPLNGFFLANPLLYLCCEPRFRLDQVLVVNSR